MVVIQVAVFLADLNECNGQNECVDHALCINTEGAYRCDCEDGYRGDGRNECKGKHEGASGATAGSDVKVSMKGATGATVGSNVKVRMRGATGATAGSNVKVSMKGTTGATAALSVKASVHVDTC